MVDVVAPRERGSAVGTFMASNDMGIAAGSTVLGLVAEASGGYRSVFQVAAGVGALGLVHWVFYLRALPDRSSSANANVAPSTH